MDPSHFKNFQGYEDDKSVDIDILLGHDFDGERSNNFEGSEMSVTCSSLTDDGEAESQFFDAEVKDGQLREAEVLSILGRFNTEVLSMQKRNHGPTRREHINGMIGGAVSFDDLEEVVENDPEIGPSLAVPMLTFWKPTEADLDGDGEMDALFAPFLFEAVPVTIDRERMWIIEYRLSKKRSCIGALGSTYVWYKPISHSHLEPSWFWFLHPFYTLKNWIKIGTPKQLEGLPVIYRTFFHSTIWLSNQQYMHISYELENKA